MKASRIMCILAHGEPPSQKHQAAHSCGKGHDGCLNPNHLRWATAKENNDDRFIHGTVQLGSEHHASKLTESDVIEIRELGRTLSKKEIAARYKMSAQQIGKIINGTRWTWLQEAA